MFVLNLNLVVKLKAFNKHLILLKFELYLTTLEF